MDSRSTFLHMYEGFTRGIEEGQWRGLMVTPCTRREARAETRVRPGQGHDPMLPRKASRLFTPAVPKPTQVGGYKHTKARGRNLVKELGNMAP